MIGVIPVAVYRIFGYSRAQMATLVIEYRNSYVECSEIDARDFGAHGTLLPFGKKSNEIDEPDQQKHNAPPDARVQIEQHGRIGWRRGEFIKAGSCNQDSIQREQKANEKPYGDKTGTVHSFTYQKIIFKMMKIAATTTAQNIGR
jgi:hypothetical protein